MKILLTSSEAVPFAKVGGLADVVGSLPTAFRNLEIDARVIIPGYGHIDHIKYGISHLLQFDFRHSQGMSEINLFSCVYDDIPFYFLQVWPYFGEEGTVYSQWNWDMERFVFFNQAVMATMWELHQRLDWFPDVLHVNDWHTGLLPYLVKRLQYQPIWENLATVISIHNIAYQGNHAGQFLSDANIPHPQQPDLVYQDLTDNLLGIGIAYSDIVSTVSPRYAEEIKYRYAGYELANLIRTRVDDLQGVLNGLDTDLWNPETDPKLTQNYNVDNFETLKPVNKRQLQSFSRLPIRDDVPVIGVVSRLASQKGFDIAIPALRQILETHDVQFVVLGTGEPDLEYALWRLDQDFRDKATAFLQFDGALAQQIYAGCDIFLMPSHFEPCGMGQMMAMRYGSLPLVRETGGLADTVANYDNGDAEVGTGFVFTWQTASAVAGTLSWAIDTYYNHKDAWLRMQTRAMSTDFSWDKSAKDYMNLYQRAINKVNG
jgi:starch synthase